MGNSQENSSDKIYEIEQYCDSENDFADTEYESDYLSDDGNYINIRFADERDIISLRTLEKETNLLNPLTMKMMFLLPISKTMIHTKRQSRSNHYHHPHHQHLHYWKINSSKMVKTTRKMKLKKLAMNMVYRMVGK